MDKLGRLMSSDLPQLIEPVRFARAGRQLAGQFALNDMPRLSAQLYKDSGQVQFNIEFGHDEENEVYFITGWIEAGLNIVCQRCLEGLELQVKNPLKLGIVSTRNEAELLPSDYEPLMLVEDSVALLDLIEDELLLALPIAALHDNENCHASTEAKKLSDIEKNKPFAELEKLKKNFRS